jgi:hypothetical protein
MSSIVTNKERIGNFTSGSISSLVSYGTREMTAEELSDYQLANPKSKKKTIECWPGRAAATYIEECNMERMLSRSLDSDVDARATSWGSFLEICLERLMGEFYEFTGQRSMMHPTIPNWAGSPDGKKKSIVKTGFEMKAPFTMKSFCTLVNPLYDGLEGLAAFDAIRNGYIDSRGLPHSPHKSGEDYWWQSISNAEITQSEEFEFIIYCPYESELEAIQSAALQLGDPKYQWIYSASKEQLPYIKDGGKYSNINIINFKPPIEDIELLRELVIKGGEFLINI